MLIGLSFYDPTLGVISMASGNNSVEIPEKGATYEGISFGQGIGEVEEIEYDDNGEWTQILI